jgi:hypothetical protein
MYHIFYHPEHQGGTMSSNRNYTAKRFLKELTLISILVIALVLTMSLIGCSSSNSQTPTSTSQSSTLVTSSSKTPTISASIVGDQYSIAVFSADSQVAAIKLDDLKNLPQVSVTADGRAQNGPTLLSVLGLAGIKDFSTITAFGYSKGRVATAELTLNKSQINDQIVLDLSNQGTAKLAGPDIPGNSWIIDVNKLVVK